MEDLGGDQVNQMVRARTVIIGVESGRSPRANRLRSMVTPVLGPFIVTNHAPFGTLLKRCNNLRSLHQGDLARIWRADEIVFGVNDKVVWKV